ncbi:MAG: hypothetical protein ACE5DM_00390 [Candidatus Nanoarchaeia archaeon]
MVKNFDRKDLDHIRARLEMADKQREELIKKGRDVIKLSKQVITLVNHDELKKASVPLKKIEAEHSRLQKLASRSNLQHVGAFKSAVQEYVEAATFYHLMKSDKLPTVASLKVGDEHYLLGICDLTGELVRKAFNSVINDDYKTAKDIRIFVSAIYDELSKAHYFSGELRKKYDGIKYDLRRLDDLLVELKLKGKI